MIPSFNVVPLKGIGDDFIGRYLANTQSGPFINEKLEHIQIARTCLTYLMFPCFDLSITEEEIDVGVLNGHYVLQPYATYYWLEHVKEGIRGDTDSADFALCQKMSAFLGRRANQNFDRKSAREERVLELKPLEKVQKHLYQDACYVDSSLASELSESLKPSKKDSESPNFRPLSLCAAGRRLQFQNPQIPEVPLILNLLFKKCSSSDLVWHCSLQPTLFTEVLTQGNLHFLDVALPTLSIQEIFISQHLRHLPYENRLMKPL